MTRYNYTCVSKSGGCLRGVWIDEIDRDIDSVNKAIMSEIAQVVYISEIPWDPFNIELIVQAQIEPKPFE